MAIDAQTARRIAAEAWLVEINAAVIGNEEIELAIAVEVEPAGGHTPFIAPDGRLQRDIFKTAIAQIAIEHVAIKARDEEIDIAIIVEVTCGGTHGITFARKARLGCDIGKFPVAIVPKEAVLELGRILLERGQGSAVGEEEIRSAIAVVIKNCDPARHGFDHVLLRCGAVLQNKSRSRWRGTEADLGGEKQ